MEHESIEVENETEKTFCMRMTEDFDIDTLVGCCCLFRHENVFRSTCRYVLLCL